MVRVWLSVKLKRHGVDCGPTVGGVGPGTRADRSRVWPHLGYILDTGGRPIQRVFRSARGINLWLPSLASRGGGTGGGDGKPAVGPAFPRRSRNRRHRRALV